MEDDFPHPSPRIDSRGRVSALVRVHVIVGSEKRRARDGLGEGFRDCFLARREVRAGLGEGGGIVTRLRLVGV